MKKIKDIISKPSQALEAMVEGLLKQDKRLDFKVKMTSFGHTDIYGMCYGCAATCAVQELFRVQFDKNSVNGITQQAETIGVNDIDLLDFEEVMDATRFGLLSPLFDYFGLELPSKYYMELWPKMTTDYWREVIPHVREVIKQLKEDGL